MTKVFIDGQEGTTGLKIYERFSGRADIELIQIDEDKRKDPQERKKLINSSDFTFLCLPDAAATEAVSLVENPNVRIIDASTAHRTNPDWAYGFPELSPAYRDKIFKACSGSRLLCGRVYFTGVSVGVQRFYCSRLSRDVLCGFRLQRSREKSHRGI